MSLLALQNASGKLPYSGIPFSNSESTYSYTYHLHSLLDIALYYEYTNDLTFLQTVWKNFTLGLDFSTTSIDETGLMYVTTSADWLRAGMGGHVSVYTVLDMEPPQHESIETNRLETTFNRTLKQTPSSTTPSTRALASPPFSTTQLAPQIGPLSPPLSRPLPTISSGTTRRAFTATMRPPPCTRKMATRGPSSPTSPYPLTKMSPLPTPSVAAGVSTARPPQK